MASSDAASAVAPTVASVARRLDALFRDALDASDRERLRPDDPAGVWIASERPALRLGLRLDAGPPPYRWARGLDAVLLHRPFGLWPRRLPAGVGALAYHGVLDAWLWTAARPALALALGVTPDAEPLWRDGRRIGCVGDAPADAMGRLAALVGPPEETIGDASRRAVRVAVVGAMTDGIVREAAVRGAMHIVTGQVRRPGVAAAEAAGVAIVATGQSAAEAWALRGLAAHVVARWPGVEVLDRTGVPRPRR